MKYGKCCRILFAFSLFILGGILILPAQVNWNIRTSTDMSTICVSEEGLILDFSVATVGTYVVEVRLAEGINYSLGTAALSANATLVAETIISPGIIEFELNVTAIGQVELIIDKIAECGVLTYVESGGILKDTATVFSGGMAVSTEAITPVYSLATPNADLQTVVTTPTSALVGETVSRTLSIANSGFGYLSEFVVAEAFTAGELTFANFVLSSGGNTFNIDPAAIAYNAATDTCFITFSAAFIQEIGDLDAFWEQGESFTLTYEVTVTDCSQNQILSSPTVYWSCQGEICTSDSEQASITIPTTSPDITVSLDSGGPDECYGYENGAKQYVFEITNTGTGTATNVRVNLSFEANFLTGYVPTAVTYRIDAGAEIPITADEVLNIVEDDFACQTNAPEPLDRQAWWLFPSLEAGSSIFLTFNEVYTCKPDVCIDNERTFVRMGSTLMRGLTFDDACGGNGQNLGTETIIRNEVFYADAVSFPANIIENGNPEEVIIDFTDMDLTNFIYDDPTAYWELNVVFPGQVDLAGAIGDISWVGGDGQIFTPSFSNIQDDQMTIRYLVNERINREGSTLRFPIQMDCTEALGSGEIFITVVLVPSLNCTFPSAYIMGCHEQEIQRICQNCPDPGMEPLSQTFERQNTGLADYDNNGCPDNDNDCDGTLQTYTGADLSALIRKDKALAGDTIFSEIKGAILTDGTYPSWQYVYLEDDFELPDQWSFVSATASIFDLSTGTTYTVDPLTATPTADGYSYDLSVASLGGILPGGFVYENGDTLTISISYRLDSVGTTDLTPFNLSSNFYTSDIANPATITNKFSCNLLDRSISAVDVNLEMCCSNTLFYEGCDSSPDENEIRIQMAGNDTGGQFFPYEYRVLSTPQIVSYTIPPGYVLDSAEIYLRRAIENGSSIPQPAVGIEVTSTTVNMDGSTTVHFDLWDPLNSGIWVQNGGSMFLSDEGYKVFPSVFLSPSCNSPASYALDMDDPLANKLSMLQNNGQVDTANMGSELQYRAPQLEASSPQATITGTLDEVSWDITLTNGSSFSAADFSWIRLFSPTNLIGSNSIVLEDNLGNPILPNADGIYELGNLGTSSSQNFTITADNANCQSDSLIVLYGWDCSGYPADPLNPACTPESLTLYINATEAQLSSSFSSLFNTPTDPADPASAAWNRTDVDMCVSFPVELTLSAVEGADLEDIVLQLTQNLGTGMGGLDYIPNSAYIEYPVGTTPRQVDAVGETALLTPDAEGNWKIDLEELDATYFGAGNALKGSYRPDSNTVILRLLFQPNCNFVSGASLDIQTLAFTSCGALATGSGTVGSSLEIPLNGVTNPYSVQFNEISLSNSFTGCTDVNAMLISFQKVGTTAVALEDSLQVFLPAGLAFDAFGGCLSGLCIDDTKRSIKTVGTQTVISWPMPDLLDGEESSFTFDVADDGGLFCTESEPIVVQSLRQTSVFCAATGSSCNSTISITGSGEVTPTADKPQLTPFFQNVVANTYPDNIPAERHEFIFDLTVTNTGTATTGDVEVWIFCANSEGTLSSDAVPLQILQVPGPIAAGSANTLNVSFFEETCDPSINGIIALIPDNLNGGGSQCFCPWPAGLDEIAANPGTLPYEGLSTAELSSVLPVEFLAFSVEEQNEHAQVSWSVFEDASSHTYQLERSLDGQTFSVLNSQKSIGIAGKASYSFQDQNVNRLGTDRLYYKVAHIDINGALSYSSIVELAISGQSALSLSVYPNPAFDEINLDIFLPSQDKYQLSIFNKLGQSMLSENIPGITSFLQRTVNVSSWPAGVYLIRLGDARESLTYKFIVK
ncbi:MAG: T9SS type A sorting domain-containing protein [Bacteroidota bacterium]